MKKRIVILLLTLLFSLGLCSGLAAFAADQTASTTVAIGQLKFGDASYKVADMSPVENSTQDVITLKREEAPAVRCDDADLSSIGYENGVLTYWWYIPNGVALQAWTAGGGASINLSDGTDGGFSDTAKWEKGNINKIDGYRVGWNKVSVKFGATGVRGDYTGAVMNSLRFVMVDIQRANPFGYAISDVEFTEDTTSQAADTVKIVDYKAVDNLNGTTVVPTEVDLALHEDEDTPQYLKDLGASDKTYNFNNNHVLTVHFNEIDVTSLSYSYPVLETWIYIGNIAEMKKDGVVGFEVSSNTAADQEEIELQPKDILVQGWNRLVVNLSGADNNGTVRGVNIKALKRVRFYATSSGTFNVKMTYPRIVDWSNPACCEGLSDYYAERFVPEELSVGIDRSKKITSIYGGTVGLTFKSNDTDIATVTADGTVTGRTEGETTVTVSDGIASYDVAVTVAADVRFVPESVTLFTGDTYKIPCETDETVTWTSKNTDIVTVGNDGTVTAVAAGNGVVTVATTQEPVRSYDIAVTVRNAKTEATLLFGADASDVSMYWGAEGYVYNAPSTGKPSDRSVTVLTHGKGHKENWFNFAYDTDASAYKNPALQVWFYVEKGEGNLNASTFDIVLASGYRRVDDSVPGPMDTGVNLYRFEPKDLLPSIKNGWNLLEIPFAAANRKDANCDISALTTMGVRLTHLNDKGLEMPMQLYDARIVASAATTWRIVSQEELDTQSKIIASQKKYTYASAPSGILSTGKDTNGVYMSLNGANPSSRVIATDLDLSEIGNNFMRLRLNVWLYVADPKAVVTFDGQSPAGFVLFNGTEVAGGVEVRPGSMGMYSWFTTAKQSGNFVKGWNKISMPLGNGTDVGFDLSAVNAMTFEQTGGSAAQFVVGDFTIEYIGTDNADFNPMQWNNWTVTAGETAASSIKITKAEIGVFDGEEFTVPAMSITCDVARYVGLWSSDRADVISINEYTGVMTVKGGGNVNITYTILGSDVKDIVSFSIEGTPLTGIAFAEEGVSIIGKNTAKLEYTVSDKGAAYDTLTFTSDNEAVATVSETGVITAHKNGTATVTVTVKAGDVSFSDTVTITVSGVTTLTGITLNETSASIDVDGTVTFTVSLQGDDLPDNYAVSWFTSDSDVATVSRGEVTGISEGTVTITARVIIDGVTKEATATVTVGGGTSSGGGDKKGGCKSNVSGSVAVLGLLLLTFAAAFMSVRVRRAIKNKQ